jgi:hypothetical protein
MYYTITENYKYYKPQMTDRFDSTLSSAIYCRPGVGLGRVIALFVIEARIYRVVGGKSVNLGLRKAVSKGLNADELIQSGKYKCCLALA